MNYYYKIFTHRIFVINKNIWLCNHKVIKFRAFRFLKKIWAGQRTYSGPESWIEPRIWSSQLKIKQYLANGQWSLVRTYKSKINWKQWLSLAKEFSAPASRLWLQHHKWWNENFFQEMHGRIFLHLVYYGPVLIKIY